MLGSTKQKTLFPHQSKHKNNKSIQKPPYSVLPWSVVQLTWAPKQVVSFCTKKYIWIPEIFSPIFLVVQQGMASGSLDWKNYLRPFLVSSLMKNRIRRLPSSLKILLQHCLNRSECLSVNHNDLNESLVSPIERFVLPPKLKYTLYLKYKSTNNNTSWMFHE